MGMKVGKGVELILEEPFPECYIYTDKNRFTQVISNFINNALKFTQQGSITLGYEQVSHQKIKFYVRDTGMGIPEEKQKSVFERFVKLLLFRVQDSDFLSVRALFPKWKEKLAWIQPKE